MNDDRAFRILSADTDTRIHAFVIGASLIVGTVGVLHALWPTFSIGIAAIFHYAFADSVTRALGVRSAR